MAGNDPVCSRCKSSTSLMWQRDSEGAVVCLDCHTAEKSAKNLRSSPSTDSLSSQNGKQPRSSAKSGQQNSPGPPVQSGVTTRRTTRYHERNKARQQQQQQQQQHSLTAPNNTRAPSPAPQTSLSTSTTSASVKPDTITTAPPTTRDKLDSPPPVSSASSSNGAPTGRGRRNLRQGTPMHAAEQLSYIISSNSVQHQGVRYEVGDVVSMLDKDGGVYYAVARGFMVDQYASKYVVLTWLLPKIPNPTHFDPDNFILGPEEDAPRSMDYIDFVCHSPQSRHFQGSYLHSISQAELWLTSNHH